jgi:hypothetical protein
MRWRVLLTASLAANLLLAAGWLSISHSRTSVSAPEMASPPQIKTNVVIRKQFFTWQQLESEDYQQYVSNLREIGCPEQTVRDIIIADVNALYARKRAMEVVSSGVQWWRSTPDSAVVQLAAARTRELEDERRALLTSLLGTGWESGDLASLPRPTRAGLPLDGPVLGTLPDDIKKSVQQIVASFQERVERWRETSRVRGQQDPRELAKLNSQFRKDLAQVLSPQQLEEFLLRYSTTASALRTELGRLKYFEATPDEFRALFRANDRINQQLQSLSGANDEGSVRQRARLEEQRDEAIRRALPPARYAEYRMLFDQSYQDAVAVAKEADAPKAAGVLYEINEAVSGEAERIRANASLSELQREIELKRIELEHLKAAALALGEELPQETATPSPPKAPPGAPHVLGPNENLNSISELYRVSQTALRNANPGVDMDRLKPGSTVNIPVPLPYPPGMPQN